MEETQRIGMIVNIADSIISGVGYGSTENFEAVRRGDSGVEYHEHTFADCEPFAASLIDTQQLETQAARCGAEGLTRIEKAMIVVADDAIRRSGIDPSSERVKFIFSTTKGNVELLEQNPYEPERVYLWRSAEIVAAHFGNHMPFSIVSNACISGACAQIEALRTLEEGRYHYAIVIGGDVLSKFIVSGFQSFKALSQKRCKPFDAQREGLNLGEAAAAIVYSHKQQVEHGDMVLLKGAIRNDANHISGPSRTGEGLYNALTVIIDEGDVERLSFINAHGTATLYNDEMESIALTRAELEEIPTASLKWHFGHTLGAAGVVESIISCMALRQGIVLPSHGFENLGVTHPINIAKEERVSNKAMCIKMLSGFGGSNAALKFELK